MKAIYNAFWMIFEKVILSLSLLVINAYVARYLGPTQYGVLAYLITILSIAVVASNFGTNTIIFQRVSKNIRSASKIIPPIQVTRFTIYFVCSLGLFLYLKLSNISFNGHLYWGLCLAFYFQAMDCYSWYFDARLKSKYNSIINMLALMSAILFRYFLVKFAADVKWFFIPYLANFAISYLIRRYAFKRNEINAKILSFSPFAFTLNKRVLIGVILAGFPLLLSEISILLYTRFSNFYLGSIVSIESVGIFNASYVLASSWTIIPIAFVTSIFTIIYQARKQDEKIILGSGLTVLILIAGVLLLLFCFYFSDLIISLVYGDGFTGAIFIFPVLCISSIFSVIGIISYRMIIAFNGYGYVAKKMIVVGILSVPLNIYLIKNYGLIGAAWAAVIIEFVSATLANYFFMNKAIMRMHWNAIMHPYQCIVNGLLKVIKNEK